MGPLFSTPCVTASERDRTTSSPPNPGVPWPKCDSAIEIRKSLNGLGIYLTKIGTDREDAQGRVILAPRMTDAKRRKKGLGRAMLALGSVGLVLSKAVNAGSLRWA